MKQKALLFLIFFAFISCDKKKDAVDIPAISSLPMTVGAEWTYERQTTMKIYESATSDKVIGLDTSTTSYTVWIDKDTILEDTMQVKVFKTQYKDYYLTYVYYNFIDHEGLKNYASTTMQNGSSIFEQININSNPTLDIPLPLDKNSKWIYGQAPYNLAAQIEKEVVGCEQLILFGQTFNCYKIEWKYPNDEVVTGVKENRLGV